MVDLNRLQVHGTRALLQGEDWLPPVVGSWNPVDTLPVPKNVAAAPMIAEADETHSQISMRPVVESESDGEDDDADSSSSLDEIPASSARDLRQIVVQLRSLNARLDDLEQTKKTTAGPVVIAPRTGGGSDPPVPNGLGGYHPPPAPFGVNKVTENALTSPAQPMGWMSRLAGSIDIGSFVRGIGAGVFSTTTAATLAAILVYFFRKRGFSFTK